MDVKLYFSHVKATVKKQTSEIVKVQIRVLGHNGPSMLQVTNEDDSLHWEGTPATELQQILGERDRAYFYARFVNRKLHLGQEAPAQQW